MNALESETFTQLDGEAQVAAVHGIEGTAENAYRHATAFVSGVVQRQVRT